MKQSILSLKKVGFQTSKQTILEEITFEVQEGEVITLTGPSGSGKSTILKLIGSLFTPTQGTISYKGEDLEKINPMNYRKEVSYFFQNAALFDRTVKDNLEFPFTIRDQEIDEEKIKAYLEKVELSDGYYDKPVTELSGGEKQRIALIRNLMFEPRVLLLDEITSSLDAKNRSIILRMLDDLNKKNQVTIIKVTHDEAEISNSSRVIKIRNGRMEDSNDE
ncbi:ATP-binding cassette domain-containing protein [Marinilactibacillus sp. Marseille-P9653]|uniref:ABC transporter ATP-binding protein n=1 Tax=Marinilactibacillus sp. Marseille-P9653 TaxID=2866583 RepID=UPI001CE3DDB2|nr:ATP-binding cassette domain-containing protein [Marinilactibacillus sp. Marseille-P9653]